MRCIETLKSNGDSSFIMINRNMRCIETAEWLPKTGMIFSINRNMRCIETLGTPFLLHVALVINRNMRCIETRIKKRKNRKQDD